jgi:beta-glucosidase
VRNQLQAIFINSSRLHIPLSWPQETLASGGPNGVLFPLPITLGASWNITLVEAVHRVLAYEARVTGVDLGYSPEINLYTDPRCVGVNLRHVALFA